MIKTEDIGKLLDKHQRLMTTLSGESLGGFAIVVPPEGQAIEIVLMDSQSDEKTFYTLLRDKLVTSKENAQLGGVRMPRGL